MGKHKGKGKSSHSRQKTSKTSRYEGKWQNNECSDYSRDENCGKLFNVRLKLPLSDRKTVALEA